MNRYRKADVSKLTAAIQAMQYGETLYSAPYRVECHKSDVGKKVWRIVHVGVDVRRFRVAALAANALRLAGANTNLWTK